MIESAARAREPSPLPAGAALSASRVEVFADLKPVQARWLDLQARAPASPYQDVRFCEAWLETVGRARRVAPFIVVVSDGAGAISALLPLGLKRRGPLGVATFLGGKDSNLNLGLFAEPERWTAERVADVLSAAGKGRIDLYELLNQPVSWNNRANPLASFPHQPSPSAAYGGALPSQFDDWFDAHYGKDTRKKWRRKRRTLAELGEFSYVVADRPSLAAAILDAFLAQRRARAQDGVANAYESGEAIAFLRRLSGLDQPLFEPVLEWHALKHGDVVAATFSALVAGDHLSGLATSFCRQGPIARTSPGELLLHDVLAEAILRGRTSFDLGIGEARYKEDVCEREEKLVDVFLPLSPLGRVAGVGLALKQRLKREIKSRPQLHEFLRAFRRKPT